MATRAKFLAAEDGERLDVLGTPMTFLATEADTGGAYEAVLMDATAGGEPIAHRHPWQEFYLVLEGTMVIQVGARHHEAGPGAFVTIPAMALHSFTVTTDRVRFLHVSLGPGANAAFRDYHDAAPGVPGLDDIPRLLEINERHGVEVVVPGIGIVRTLDDLVATG